MEGKSVAGRIHDAIHRLTAAEKRAARGLLGSYPTLGLAPVAEFAQQAGASSATVLRFVAQLGYKSYPDFQRALREELDERSKSPLQRSQSVGSQPSGDNFLDRFVTQEIENLRGSASLIPASEFEEVCERLADTRGACWLAGGRFTDFVAGYMEAHLRLIRQGVRRLDGRAATRADQLIDVKPGDVAIIFDVRRYDPGLVDVSIELAARRAQIVLVTDEWMSPVSRFAKLVLPCRTDMGRTWDANGALFTVIEAVIARTTELSWPTASKRMGSIEGA
ncbi:MurR/RpiR family transcriptional regulator [Devosia oryziradicis]|uniref:MurR/RpiR family transcriptional regulator n=1 Tax=Devosia oryziradicis TaxID=2801335 RepID=A0ABX7BX10_9HYPH|nr:MurR/RpiR family transcriptional regulator [Devosia oryziradicis]QQR36028.1 MurR/RpiR family transcriptional regulator [Devosia oryziradicis]